MIAASTRTAGITDERIATTFTDLPFSQRTPLKPSKHSQYTSSLLSSLLSLLLLSLLLLELLFADSPLGITQRAPFWHRSMAQVMRDTVNVRRSDSVVTSPLLVTTLHWYSWPSSATAPSASAASQLATPALIMVTVTRLWATVAPVTASRTTTVSDGDSAAFSTHG